MTIIAISGFILFFLSPLAEGEEIFTYQVVAGEQIVGKIEYHLFQEENSSHLTITSFIQVGEESEPEKSAQLIINQTDFTPITSKSWINLPNGTLYLETNYYPDYALITLESPQGEKQITVPLKEITFDAEGVPFLLNFLDPEKLEEEIFSILIPISGMLWRGKATKIEEDEETVLIQFNLAGEILYFKYEKGEANTPFLEMQAPYRGYNLVQNNRGSTPYNPPKN